MGWWGPDGTTRLVVATTDPHALPDKTTWYLATNLPRPGGPAAATGPHPPASLAEIVYLCGLHNRVEQSCQTDHRRAGVGRLPGPLPGRDPPPPESGWLRLLLVLGYLVDHPAPTPASTRRSHTEGAPRANPASPSWPHALRAVRSWLNPAITLARWWRAWSPAAPRVGDSNCSTRSALAMACTSTFHLDPTNHR